MQKANPLPFNEFYRTVLERSLTGLRCNYFPDNFDLDRPGWEDGERAKIFDSSSSAFYFDWFIRNKEDIFRAYLTLNDVDSRALYIDLICFRLAGNLSIRINVPWDLKSDQYKEYKKNETFSPSKLDTKGILGDLQHFDFEHMGQRYIADCKGFEYILYRRQYYYEGSGISVKPESGDVVIDGGACLGDTALAFSNTVGPNGKVIAFDPVGDNLKVLEYNLQQFPFKNVVLMPFGLSDRDVDALPIFLDHYDPAFRVENQLLPLCRIDSLFESGLKKLDFIKLDIEGSELACLKGAENTISNLRPKLAVSLYHNPDDIFSIINYLHQKYPFYKFYLGHYTYHEGETVLYCK